MDTRIRYLSRSPLFETDKAFSTDFPVDHVEGARRTNHEAEHRPMSITAVEDPSHWELDVHGFCFVHAKTDLAADNVYKNKKEVQAAYWYEIEAILHKSFPQYSRIESFDLTVNGAGPGLPGILAHRTRSRGYRDEYEQPSSTAHCNYSQNEGYWKDKDFDLLKLDCLLSLFCHLKLMNEHSIWRPLRGPTDDWPLAICDYTTIDLDEDIRLSDSIRRDLVSEASLLHHNPTHRWYYLKDQGVGDLLVFRNANARGKGARKGPPRESVEVRVVAFY
ncbi:putative CmcJ-like methyltransferase [Lasiosphaeria ovina]|uniref:CmcJ-like methyltransferase n=1 Tax=Lasiosphaeria ovina TaxID=92902 RepID=A0AAE0TWE0_9PEZI|nr:putative CmcJ-like methyltransferase [Lasiosphaeria ovina]